MTRAQQERLVYLFNATPCTCATDTCMKDCLAYLSKVMFERFKDKEQQTDAVEKLVEEGDLCISCHGQVNRALG